MPIPDFQSLMLPVLRLATAGEVVIGEAIERLADDHRLTPAERAALLPSGRQGAFANRVHWAKFNLGKAGLIAATGRGRFALTDRGRAVLGDAPERLTLRYLHRFAEFAAHRERRPGADGAPAPAPWAGRPTGSAPAAEAPPEAEALTPEDAIQRAREQIEARLVEDLLAWLRAASPRFFEGLVVRLLVAVGYGGSVEEAGRAIGQSGDRGIDGVINEDALGLDQVYVQAKRYAADRPVSAGEVRDFFGALDGARAAKGVLVTTSAFTRGARDAAERFSRRIVLVDGEGLARLMVRHEIGCRAVETIRLKAVDENDFED